MPARPSAKAGDGRGPDKGSGKRCPICGKPAVEAVQPFCSRRCRDVDLNRWLSNSYAIPGSEHPEDDAE